MKLILLLLLIGGSTAVAASAHHQAMTSPAPTAVPTTPIQTTATTIVPPSGSWHVTKDQALAAARQYWPSEFTGKYPVTIQFGGANLSNLQRRINGQLRIVGRKDVWFVTVTGLDEARPAGSLLRTGLQHPGAPPVHTRTFVVDDSNGQVLLSAGM